MQFTLPDKLHSEYVMDSTILVYAKDQSTLVRLLHTRLFCHEMAKVLQVQTFIPYTVGGWDTADGNRISTDGCNIKVLNGEFMSGDTSY